MMLQPAMRSNWQVCDALAIQHYASWISRYCETVRLPLNTRRLEQFADRREGPAADVGYPERSTKAMR
jgi:hypothetical protein